MSKLTKRFSGFFPLSLLILAGFLVACSAKKSSSEASKELRIFTWSDYLQDSMIQAFEKKTGVKIKLDYFSSNEELLTKVQGSVQSGSDGYDLIMPSDYMVDTMIHLKLLQALQHEKLPFLKEISDRFRSPTYDPGLQHSVPVAWGTTGVAVNTKLAKNWKTAGGVSWRDFFENPAYAGKVTFLDDMKEVFHAALLVQGKKWQDATESDIKQAYAYIKKHKQAIKAFTGESRPVMEASECVLCQAYSGDALRAQKSNQSLVYVIPKEGATLWTDNFAIPKNARNLEMAYAFLNYFLASQEARNFTQATYFASPNEIARSLLPEEVRANSTIFPSEADMGRLALIQEKPELMLLIDQYWTELRAE